MNKKIHQSILYQIRSSGGVLMILRRANFVYFNCSKINKGSYEFRINESWAVDSLFPPLSQAEIVTLPKLLSKWMWKWRTADFWRLISGSKQHIWHSRLQLPAELNYVSKPSTLEGRDSPPRVETPWLTWVLDLQRVVQAK